MKRETRDSEGKINTNNLKLAKTEEGTVFEQKFAISNNFVWSSSD